jgi:multimeric flavodoxin WrbA
MYLASPTIKLLGISGSPRKSGNSRFLLEQALRSAEAALGTVVQSDLVSFAGKEIRPCNSCFRCIELGRCAIEDDFQGLRDKWVEADAILYSVPVYHMSVPGQVKCFIDRLGNSLDVSDTSVSKHLKTVGAITQGADLYGGQELALAYLTQHAICMSCLPVAGDAYGSYIGAAGWTGHSIKKDSLQRLHSSGDLAAETAVAAAETVARRAVQVALLIKSGGLACKTMLEEDGGYGPLLKRLAR